MTDWSEYQDDISDAISDSVDMDWNANDGARAVVRWLNENKPLAAAPAAPQAAGVGELLPCPFCGQAVSIRKGVNSYGHCKTEGCHANRAQIVPLDDAKQVSAWNLRAPSRDPEGGAVDAFSPYEWANGDGPNGATPYGIDDLVDRFASALKEKLHAAEAKYGHDDAWKRDDWREDLCRQLGVHVQKGDPRDVAAYCAFAWHHGWSLAALTPKEAPELALEDAMRFGVGFIVDGQRVSPDRVTVCRGEEAPAATGAGEADLDILTRWASGDLLMRPERVAEVVKRVLPALRAQPQAREDYSSLIAARCSALPDKLIDCPVCLAVDNERDRLAREEAQPVMTVTLVDAGPALAIRKWDNLGLTPGSHTLYTTPPTQSLAEGADAEKLRVAVEALEPFAAACLDRESQNVKTLPGGASVRVTLAQCRAARKALAALQQEGR